MVPCCRIIANPVSGTMSENEKYRLLKRVALFLKAEIHGLDTRSEDELRRCAREQAEQCDVLVVGGGDGTMSLVINAVDLASTVLAFIPFGTGNALAHALGYRGGLPVIAERVRNGIIHEYDLIDCDTRRKAFMASLGIDSVILKRYNQHKSSGHKGLAAYLSVGLKAYFREYRPTNGSIHVAGHVHRITRLLSVMVLKQPFVGMGLKVAPHARWNDGFLHLLTMTSGLPGLLVGLATGFTIGNRAGCYEYGKAIRIFLDDSTTLQIDGELAWTQKQFSFKVIPAVLRMKH
jgi:diacylglycerol kinase family enzyme